MVPAMETHTNGSNGKALVRTLVPPAPAVKPLKPAIERIFTLASEVVQLESKLAGTMDELKELVTHMDPTDMPKLIVTMMKQGVASSALATLAFPEPPKIIDVVTKEPTMLDDLVERITVLMRDGRERAAAAIIKAIKAKKHQSMAYLALKQLVRDNVLVKPYYGHYRKRDS